MSTDRNILCGGAAGPPPLPAADCVCLDQFGPLANVRLQIEDIRGPLAKDVPDRLLDLLDVATYVYVADQAVPRGRPEDADLGARWRRRLFFRVPVRVPDLWTDRLLRAELEGTLGFLSDDEYHFEFVPWVGGRAEVRRYLDFNGQTPLHGLVDEVVMFSGGLDSLAGAVGEAVTHRRRVLLVNHRSTPKGMPQHARLLDALRARAADAPPEHVAVWVNKAEGLGRAFEQRARSFLFAALGAVFAAQLDLPRFRFYENGVLGLNLPTSGQLVGARATRTTHPKALAGFERLFGMVVGRPMGVENPFRWHTKADVVRVVAAAGCGELIADSVSCARTHGQSARRSHCGRCSQCIERRLAVLAAGCQGYEPPELYEVELFTDPRERTDERHLVASYLQAANDFERMEPAGFVTRFGELARALRHLDGDPETVVRRLYDLHVRHGRDVCGVLDRTMGQHATALRRGDLPPSCALRLLVDPGDRPADETPPEEPKNYFRRHGEGWEARYEGGARIILLDRRGAGVVHQLLSQPGMPVFVQTLMDESGRSAEISVPSVGDPIHDPAGLEVFNRRFAELREQKETARRANDTATVSETDREIAALAAEVKSATGLGGRQREMGDLVEKARKAVTQRVAAVRKAIDKTDSGFAAHLKASIRGGPSFVYAPDELVEWSL